jgi:hypothetical protein
MLAWEGEGTTPAFSEANDFPPKRNPATNREGDVRKGIALLFSFRSLHIRGNGASGRSPGRNRSRSSDAFLLWPQSHPMRLSEPTTNDEKGRPMAGMAKSFALEECMLRSLQSSGPGSTRPGQRSVERSNQLCCRGIIDSPEGG